MVDVDEFIGGGGTRIKWGKLLSVIVGATIGAFFQGIVRIMLRWMDASVALLEGVAEFATAVVQLRFGASAQILAQAWRNTLTVVEDAGLFAFVLAIAIVLTTFYVFQVLRPRPWGDDG